MVDCIDVKHETRLEQSITQNKSTSLDLLSLNHWVTSLSKLGKHWPFDALSLDTLFSVLLGLKVRTSVTLPLLLVHSRFLRLGTQSANEKGWERRLIRFSKRPFRRRMLFFPLSFLPFFASPFFLIIFNEDVRTKVYWPRLYVSLSKKEDENFRRPKGRKCLKMGLWLYTRQAGNWMKECTSVVPPMIRVNILREAYIFKYWVSIKWFIINLSANVLPNLTLCVKNNTQNPKPLFVFSINILHFPSSLQQNSVEAIHTNFPTLSTEKPTISPFRFPATLTEGMSVITTCSILTGDPPIHVDWFKDSLPLDLGTLNVHRNEMGDLGSSLVFRSVGQSHAGNYTCTARNRVGEDTYTAPMIVKSKLNLLLVSKVLCISLLTFKSIVFEEKERNMKVHFLSLSSHKQAVTGFK